MGTIREAIPVRRAVNDANERLRVRLAGRALPDPAPVAAELRRLVLQRLDPRFLANNERSSQWVEG